MKPSLRQAGAPTRWPELALAGPGAWLGPGGGWLRTARRHLFTANCLTAPSPDSPPFGMGVHASTGMYAATAGWGTSPAQQPPNASAPRGKARNSAGGLEFGLQSGAAAEAAIAAYSLPRLFRRAPGRPERLPSRPSISPGCRPSRRLSRLTPRGTDAVTV